MDDRIEALERLAAMLEALADKGEAMTVGETDGFVTGLAVYPERIPMSEWLPIVWGAAMSSEAARRPTRRLRR